jgi:hypothetical protein
MLVHKILPTNTSYFMRGVKLGTTEEERDIGVTVARNLKPSAQCNKAAGRATAVGAQKKLPLPGQIHVPEAL